MPETINFYYVGEEYGEFSNFAAFPIELDGKVWPTSEHYFQAMKFEGTEHVETLRNEPSPMTVAKMGRDRKRPLRPDWESVKDDIMQVAVEAKVAQHQAVRQLLLDTGDGILVEHTKNDAYWGDGGDGSGKNMLGQLLMQIRAQLQKQSAGE